MKKFLLTFLLFGLGTTLVFSNSQSEKNISTTIKLNEPELQKGKPLMEVLKNRKSSREFSNKKLSIQELSNLLWAAGGINRKDLGLKTVPSSRNKQEVDIYVILESGAYLYNAKASELTLISSGDFRKDAGVQDFVAEAPVNMIYVSDYDKIGTADENEKNLTAGIDVGHSSQNVYLYCASEGLNVVVRGYVDKEKLTKILKLKPNQKIIVGQTVGKPK